MSPRVQQNQTWQQRKQAKNRTYEKQETLITSLFPRMTRSRSRKSYSKELVGPFAFDIICIFFKNQKDSVFFIKAAAAPRQSLGHIICTCDTIWVYFKLVPQKVSNKLTNPCYLVGIKHLVAMAQKQFRPYDHEFPATVNALKRIQPKSTYWCVQGAMVPCY